MLAALTGQRDAIIDVDGKALSVATQLWAWTNPNSAMSLAVLARSVVLTYWHAKMSAPASRIRSA